MQIILPKDLKSQKGIPYCNEHRRQLEKAGKFPKRVRLSEDDGFYGYIEEEIDAYLEARAAARETEAA